MSVDSMHKTVFFLFRLWHHFMANQIKKKVTNVMFVIQIT